MVLLWGVKGFFLLCLGCPGNELPFELILTCSSDFDPTVVKSIKADKLAWIACLNIPAKIHFQTSTSVIQCTFPVAPRYHLCLHSHPHPRLKVRLFQSELYSCNNLSFYNNNISYNIIIEFKVAFYMDISLSNNRLSCCWILTKIMYMYMYNLFFAESVVEGQSVCATTYRLVAED